MKTKKPTSRNGTAVKRKPSARKRSTTSSTRATTQIIPRATSGYDEDDVLLAGGSSRGASFGRCGGRILSSRIEQTLCDRLSRVGITHSHSPRHFEVQMAENEVAAYAPMVVLRGRGRQGKTVVIEAAGEVEAGTLVKIQAFREKFGAEFYVIFIAPEEVLDDIPLAAYDESCTTNDLDALVGRLSE